MALLYNFAGIAYMYAFISPLIIHTKIKNFRQIYNCKKKKRKHLNINVNITRSQTAGITRIDHEGSYFH